MRTSLRAVITMGFWFSIGLTMAVLVLKPNTLGSAGLKLMGESPKVIYQHRLSVPTRFLST